MIANVMLTDAAHALDRTFDYKIPTELEPCAAVGMRVLVPFGVHKAPIPVSNPCCAARIGRRFAVKNNLN